MDSTIYFGKIYIVEWLGPRDVRTGWELFGELQPIAIMSKPQVEVSFFTRVASRDEFMTYLRSIQDDFRQTKKLPLIHIETHGVRDDAGHSVGIGLGGNDTILWPELMAELIPLNQLTSLRLVVVLASCDGLWGLQMLQPVERAAFLALLGPKRSLDWDDLLRACVTFYRVACTTRSGNAAFNAMNDAVNRSQPTFGMINAEMAFRWVYGGFLRERCSPKALEKRVETIVADRVKTFRKEHGVGMWKHEVEHARASARRHVEAHDEFFDERRRDYFLIDLVPDNDRRFPITLKDCLADTGDNQVW